MDYISYILIVLAICALIILMTRDTRRIDLGKNQKTSARAASRHSAKNAKSQLESATHALSRETLNIPTPWGWAGSKMRGPRAGQGSGQGANGASSSLYRLIDLMMSEKQTVDNREYLLKKDASMRAMLEDRYGRQIPPTEIEFKRVKPPLLRDPNGPVDQMDSFRNGQANDVAQQLRANGSESKLLHKNYGPIRERAYLKEVKTPWGW